MGGLDNREIRAFRKVIRDYYGREGRRLPWRETTDPYQVLVSEIMLQQTQVSRVLTKFPAFIERFPKITDLAAAPLQEVLSAWQGLGYNRRARSLKEAAEQILENHGGSVPENEASLTALPGIGTATARAIQAYAFNIPVVFIETNIRAVYLYYFFRDLGKVSDRELEPYVEQTLDRRNPRRWYNALMDYGVYLKKNQGNPARASAHYARQTPFEGSLRQVRGAVLRRLLEGKPLSDRELYETIPYSSSRVEEAILGLEKDRLVSKNGSLVTIHQDQQEEEK